MGFKKNNPGCNCCDEQGCEITPITWTTDSGTWDTSTSTAPVCSAAGNIHCNEAQPDGDITMRVTGTFQIGTSGSTADVIVGWVDATHYFYARYIRSGASSDITIRRNNGGTHSTLATSPTVTINSAPFTFEVCVDASANITASLNGEGKVFAAATAITGTKMGLGQTGSGTVTFGSIAYQMTFSVVEQTCDKCVVQCTDNGDVTDDACCDDTPPSDMDVTFPSDWTGIGDCAWCDAIPGGTYTMAYDSADIVCFLLGERCLPNWGLSISLGSPTCNAHGVGAGATTVELRFQICCNASPHEFTCRAEFVLGIKRSSTVYAAWRWAKTYSSLLDCTQIFDLPWDGATSGGCSDAFGFCNFANSSNVIIQVH